MGIFCFLWRWFKDLDLARKIIFGILISYLTYAMTEYSIAILRFKYATTKYDCGIFSHYEYVHNNPGSRGTAWTNTWIIIDSWGKEYRFLYLPKHHKHISFIQNSLKQGQKVCFEYLNIWVLSPKETTLKSFELRGEK